MGNRDECFQPEHRFSLLPAHRHDLQGSTLSSGSGLVEFQTVGMANKAISQLNNTELAGWKIHVREERTGLSIGQGEHAVRLPAACLVTAGDVEVTAGISCTVTTGVDRRAALGLTGSRGGGKGGRGGGRGGRRGGGRGSSGQQAALQAGSGKRDKSEQVTIRFDGGGTKTASSSGGFGRAAGRQIFVGNLPSETTWQNLKEVFSNVGKVERADVKPARSGATGIVLMGSNVEANKAIQTFHSADFDGRTITVKFDALA